MLGVIWFRGFVNGVCSLYGLEASEAVGSLLWRLRVWGNLPAYAKIDTRCFDKKHPPPPTDSRPRFFNYPEVVAFGNLRAVGV